MNETQDRIRESSGLYDLFSLALIWFVLSLIYPFCVVSEHIGTADFHATIEMVGSVIGLLAGMVIVGQFCALGNRFHLLIGLAFFVNGAEDFIHGALAFGAEHELLGLPAATLQSYIPGTYVTGRILMGLLLIGAVSLSSDWIKSADPKKETITASLLVLFITAIATALAFLLPLPGFIYPGRVISRPVDFLSALIFLAALIPFVRKYIDTRDALVWWIALSIGVNVVGQILMSFSQVLFDPFFEVAHVYKVTAYALPLFGFSLYQISITIERKEALATLGRSHEALEERVAERTAELEQKAEELRIALDDLALENATRKKAEEEAKSRRAFLETVIESLPHPFYVIDTDTYSISLANSAAKQNAATGAKTCYAVTHYESAPCSSSDHPCPVDIVRKTGRPTQLEHLHFDSEGNQRFVEVHAFPILDAEGRVTQMIEYSMDVTERKRAEGVLNLRSQISEAFLKVSDEDMYSDVLDIVREALQSEFGVFGYVDEAGALVAPSMTSRVWEACQVPGKRFVFPRETWGDSSWPTAMREKRAIVINETSTKIPEGHIPMRRHISAPIIFNNETVGLFQVANKESDYTSDDLATLMTIADQVGPLLYSSIQRDISERGRMEAEKDLLESNDKLTQSNEYLQQFAYVASHDLQEPLRMVSSYLQLLERRYKGQLDSDADEFIHYAVDGATRMKQMIQDLLAFSRVQSRGSKLTTIDLKMAVNQAISNLKILIEETGAEIVVGDLPTVEADGGQMVNLFQNLISNAIRFRSDAPPRIDLSAEDRENEWKISVRDNGIGIEADYFERIFVIFQRLQKREESSGTGIGLALCKRIVERHSGKIWVSSEQGAGSTFHFTLPKQGGDSHESSL